MGFLQIVTGTGSLALAFGVVTMAGRSDFGWANGLFWGSAVVAVAGALWYGFTTSDPAPLRIGSEVVAGLYVGIILPMLFQWLKTQKLEAGASRGGK